MNIFIMQGTTLAGKTQHGKTLATRNNLEYISSGDIARSLMDDKTKALFANGQLSPHDAAIRHAIYSRVLTAHSTMRQGIVIDGFPRTAAHVIDFANWLKWVHIYCRVIVVKLVVPIEIIMKRAGVRGRDEFDTPEVVERRDAVYREETEPALDFLGERIGRQVVITLTAEAEPENVYWAIDGELEALRLL